MATHKRASGGETGGEDGRIGGVQSEAATSSGLGPFLRAAREQSGRELALAAQQLRIRDVYLEAIEAGRWGDLPGRAYAQGFVRAYAVYLGLDGEEAARRFKEEAVKEKEEDRLDFPAPVSEGKMPGGALLMLSVLLGAAVYGGWYYLSRSQDRQVQTMLHNGESLMNAGLSGGSEGAGATPPAPVGSIAAAPQAGSAAPSPAATTSAGVAPAASGPATSGQGPSAAAPAQAGPAAAASAGAAPQGADAKAPDAKLSEPKTPAAETKMAEAKAAAPTAEGVKPGDAKPADAPGAGVKTADTKAADAKAVEAKPAVAKSTDATAAEEARASAAAVAAFKPAHIYGEKTPSRVVIRAKGLSWVEIKDSKGTLWLSRTLHPGDVFQAPDRDDLRMLTGNGAGLEILVDGKPAAGLGALASSRRKVVSLDPVRLLNGTALDGVVWRPAAKAANSNVKSPEALKPAEHAPVAKTGPADPAGAEAATSPAAPSTTPPAAAAPATTPAPAASAVHEGPAVESLQPPAAGQ